MPGALYIVATPIGNLDDLTPRIKTTLDIVDLILVEDTRRTIKLLNHSGIKKRMISCHNFNEKSRLSIITECSQLNQKVALVSDAGTPLISDPGNEIVRQAIECGMTIIPIPGPSAFLLALVASGLPCDRFVFEGFLPSKAAALKERLENLQSEERTIILYEAPHRLLKTLLAVQDILGDREICLARELTKIHEEFVRDKLSKVIDKLTSSAAILGEYVIVIAGQSNTGTTIDNKELQDTIKQLFDQGISVKTIVQHVTQMYDLKRSDVYQMALQIQKEKLVGSGEEKE